MPGLMGRVGSSALLRAAVVWTCLYASGAIGFSQCKTVKIAGQPADAPDAELMGLYSMQYDVFDLRPTYVQNSTKPGRQPAYLYYDSSSMAWKIGSTIGEGRAVYIYLNTIVMFEQHR